MSINEAKWERHLLAYVAQQVGQGVAPAGAAPNAAALDGTAPSGGAEVAEESDQAAVVEAPSGATAVLVARPVSSAASQQLTTPVANQTVTATAAVRPTKAQPIITQSDVQLVRPVARPQWAIKALPLIPIEPAPSLAPPVRVGDMLLWADAPRSRALYALCVPLLRDFSLTVRRENVGNTIKITGATAVLSVSAYTADDPPALEALRPAWTAALTKAGHSQRTWSFQPMHLRGLQGTLDAAAGHFSRPPQVTVSTETGTATFLLELTELGAQVWKDALEQSAARTIPGVCRLDASFYVYVQVQRGVEIESSARTESIPQLERSTLALSTARAEPLANTTLRAAPIRDLPVRDSPVRDVPIRDEPVRAERRTETRVEVRRHLISAPLGTVLGALGPGAVRVVNPQLTVTANFIVAGHPIVENVVVDWRPSGGHEPLSQVFGPEGGQFQAQITSDNLDAIAIDWTAIVRYKPAGWPVIRRSGKLSFASTNWSEIINPVSWTREYVITTMLLDAQGRVLPAGGATNLVDRVQGTLTYSAPFLTAEAPLTNFFETSNQHMVKVSFPLPPDQQAGELKLTLFATRGGGTPTMVARRLLPDETMVVAKIAADAKIEIFTNLDVLPEASDETDMFTLMTMLQ
ncbi:MAG: hypothetical protein M3442_13295 [Chloroflexota bacterium]|nr:hypothetical protein [Chloroflexota bacterium]